MIHTERSTLVPRQVTRWQVVCEQCNEIACRSHYHGHNCIVCYKGKYLETAGHYLCSVQCWQDYLQERGLE